MGYGEAKASDVLFMRSCQILQGNRGDMDGGQQALLRPPRSGSGNTQTSQSTSGSRTFRVHGCKCSGEMWLRCLTVNITSRSLTPAKQPVGVTSLRRPQARLQHLSSLKSVSGLSGQLTWHQVSSRDVSSSTYWENHCCRHCCSLLMENSGARRHQCDR